MIKAEVPPMGPALAVCISRIRARFSSQGYANDRKGGHDIYEAACVAMALANLDAEGLRSELQAIANYMIAHQNANGSWDYTGRSQGDTSITQYGVLGLWECENAGIDIPPNVWDRAATWFLSVQGAGGSWNYHRDEGTQYPETLSMTAAGIGSLLICNRQLARYRKGVAETSMLLTALVPEGHRAKYDVGVTHARVDGAAKRGLGWMGSNFTLGTTTIVGQSPFYYLYAVERVGALMERESSGRSSWLAQGDRYIRQSQKPDGSWTAQHGDVANTCWSILFITKSTAKTLKKIEIKRLGAGTLLGGRGLPADLSNLTMAGGRVVSRPMNGAVEGMLAVLEDPRAQNADSALSGLVGRYQKEGPAVLRPHKDRFRKLMTDPDPGIRKVSAWALSRTTDLDVVPNLIEGLKDPDESVVTASREGLQLLSRKVTSLGPPTPSTPEQRIEAAKRWHDWYANIRPLDLEGQDEQTLAATPGSTK